MLAALVAIGGNVRDPEPGGYITNVKARTIRHENTAKP